MFGGIMQINKKLRSGDDRIDTYIEQLEEELLTRENSSIHKLIRNANKAASVISEDMGRISEGRDSECIILKDDKDDKRLERILSVIKCTDAFKEISILADELIPEIVNEALDLKVKIEEGENAFEKMQGRVKEHGRR